MIKAMRHKVIAVSTVAMLLLLISIFVTINLYMEQIAMEQVNGFIKNVLGHEGRVDHQSPKIVPTENIPPERISPESIPPENIPMVNGFSFLVSSEREILEVIYNDESIEDESIEQLVAKVKLSERATGSIDNYRYGVKVADDRFLVVMADTSVQNVMLEKLLRLSYIIGAISFGVIFILIIILSRYITKPVEVAFEKQKRFIADSSHELKTPLSVISANLDLLEMDIGKNSRTNAISDGIKRMNKLIHELLLLARTEQKSHAFLPFNLSEVMESTILPLEVIAYEQGNQIETNIEENIMLKGDEEGFRKMIGALMENAIKYSRENSIIKADLYTKGDYKIIEIFNEGIGVTKEQKGKLFDKFYRVDDSRNRETGGHGIGLSIVKNIVDIHKGKIQVESVPNEYIIFKITLRG